MTRKHNERTDVPLRIILCGACMTGNMGGAALNVSLVETLRRSGANIDVTLLSKYPDRDREPCARMRFRMRSFPTSVQLLLGVPFSLFYALLRWLRLPRRWLAAGPLSEYVDGDLLVDLSGISFSDERPLTGLLINCLWLLPAVATGIPFVKASQAMGPFSRPLVRVAARFFLGRAGALIARGEESERLLWKLLPTAEIHRLPDVAFVLPPAPPAEVDAALQRAGVDPHAPYCVVGPSWVVDQRMRDAGRGETYPQLMACVADELVQLSGHSVLLIPHDRDVNGSMRDDLSVCKATHNRSANAERLAILDGAFTVQELKGIVARAEIVVGSRFHLMVAAMSSSVPGIAVSWGHKYAEMMRMVGQEHFAIAHQSLSVEVLLKQVRTLWSDRERVRHEIGQHLPEVVTQAEKNGPLALRVLSR